MPLLDHCSVYVLWNFTNRQSLAGGTPPAPRSGHSAVALGDSLVVYGGMNVEDNITFNDIFELQTGK